MPDVIPDEVKRFIMDNIDSVAELEAILFLRDQRHQAWDLRSIAARIYTRDDETAALLAKLIARGFIVEGGTEHTAFRYQPQTPTLAEALDSLALVYSHYLVPVTNLIHMKSRRSIEGFADAFKFFKEK